MLTEIPQTSVYCSSDLHWDGFFTHHVYLSQMAKKIEKAFQVQYLTCPKLILAIDQTSSLTSTSFVVFIEKIIWWTAAEVTSNIIITVMTAGFIHKIHALIQVCKCEKMNQPN